MKPKVPQPFAAAVATHRNRLERIAVGGALGPLKKLYDEAQAAVVAKAAKLAKAQKGETFTAHQQRVVLAQVREGQKLVTQRMAGKMGPLSANAQKAALKGLSSDVARLSKKFTGAELVLPIDEAATLAGVVQKRQPSLLRQHQTSMARYGTHLVEKVEKKLAMTLLTGASSSEAMDDVAEAIDKEWYWGERIVRTEMAYAFNAAHRDGIEESGIDGLRMRWEEHCDAAGFPLDDRVAVDSLAMHGQVAGANGLFTMPATAPVPDKDGSTKVPFQLVGLQWEFPPNRPNDRAVLSPWMPDWGIPGWMWSGGRRVWL